MKYIIRKFIEAKTVHEALQKEPSTPVHDACLKEGEEPDSKGGLGAAIGFSVEPADQAVPYEMHRSARKR